VFEAWTKDPSSDERVRAEMTLFEMLKKHDRIRHRAAFMAGIRKSPLSTEVK
jgi:hypothetical protein